MSFWSRRDGNMVMIFALTLVPMIGLIGFGVDSSRQHSAAKQLQQAVDTAAIAAARTLTDTAMTVEERSTYVTDLVNANLASKGDVTLNAPVVTYPEANAIRVATNGTVPTTFSAIMGRSTMSISASAGARFSSPSVVEAVLVLDITESMDGAAIADLKIAAKAFGQEILHPSKPDVKMGIVPFAQYVNVGVSNRNADWIDVPADYTNSGTNCYDDGCTCEGWTTTTSNWVNDETGASGTSTNTSCVSWDCSSSVEVCTPYSTDYTWYGCVSSRAQPFNVQDTRWDIDAEGFLGSSAGPCPSSEILPLTNNAGTITSQINSLSAAGKTYIPAGLAWGLRVLSPNEPFSEAMDAATFASQNGKKLMVLMSDGANTRSLETGGMHNGTDSAVANTETLAACDEIKAAGIDLFVIAFNVTDATTIAMLQQCASTFTHYSAATNVAELTAGFQAAGASIADITLFD